MRREQPEHGQPALRDRHCRGVAAAVADQLRLDVSVGACRRDAVGRWDRLIDFDPRHLAAKDPMRAQRRHVGQQPCRLVREQRMAADRSQAGDGPRIGRAHADLRLRLANAEIEQDRRAILQPDGLMIGAELGDLGELASRAPSCGRQSTRPWPQPRAALATVS